MSIWSESLTSEQMEHWDEWIQRLKEIIQEVKNEVGEAPIFFANDGGIFLHPVLSAKLNEPGNEGPMEVLQYMRRTGIANL